MTTAVLGTEQNRKEIGKRIRVAAREAGMTLRELADVLGVARPTIYAYASGNLSVTRDRLDQIASVTSSPIENFMLDDEPIEGMPSAIEHADALLGAPDPDKAIDFAVASAYGAEADSWSKGALLKRAGTALLMKGDYLGSLQYLESAREIFDTLAERAEVAACRQSIGHCYTNLGELDKARSAFVDALDLYAPELRWKPRVSLAVLAERIGEHERARQMLETMAEESLDDLARMYVLANTASLGAAMGIWNGVLEPALQALDLAAVHGIPDQVTELSLQVAEFMLATGEFEQASLWLMRATDHARISGDTARESLSNLLSANMLIEIGHYDQARRITVDVLTEAARTRLRRLEVRALLQLSRLARSREDHEGARDYAHQALGFAEANSYYVQSRLAAMLLCEASLELEEFGKAEAILRELEADVRLRELGEPYGTLLSAQAKYRAKRGKPEDAASISRTALEVFARSGAALRADTEAELLSMYSGTAHVRKPGPRGAAGRMLLKDSHIYLLQGYTISRLESNDDDIEK